MPRKILADENMGRLAKFSWSPVLRCLERRGYQVEFLPNYMHGASDEEVIDFAIKNGYDGILTEDKDFTETHRSKLMWKLLNNGKELLAVRRVNPNVSRGEVRVYRYTRWGKEELCRLVIDY